jgi:alkylation response protein AidB-like acyl-CoA dehydrogenase
MRFSFSAEQLALRDVARDVLEREFPPSKARAVAEGEPVDEKLWARLAEIGLLDLPTLEDAVLVMEEAGRAALPLIGHLSEPVARAALVNGVSIRLLEMTTDYVKQREQFGRPVGSFQAVKHKLASVLVALEQARAANHYAAYAATHALEDASIAESASVVSAYDAHLLTNTEALQCHSGIGFTWEHDLHLWLRCGLEAMDALSAPEHRARLADSLTRS